MIDCGARTSLSAKLAQQAQTVNASGLFALRAHAGRDARAPVRSAMTAQTITVKVLFFGAARDATGAEDTSFELPDSPTTATAREVILARYPALARFGK